MSVFNLTSILANFFADKTLRNISAFILDQLFCHIIIQVQIFVKKFFDKQFFLYFSEIKHFDLFDNSFNQVLPLDNHAGDTGIGKHNFHPPCNPHIFYHNFQLSTLVHVH